MTAPPSSPLEQRRLDLLYRISREVSGRPNLAELVPRLLAEVVEGLPAQTGSLIVLDEAGRVLHAALMADGKLQPDAAKLLAGMLENGLAGWVLHNRQAVLIPDTAKDPRWNRLQDGTAAGPMSALSVPLLGRDRVVGVLTVAKGPPGAFDEDDLSLLTAIAAHAAAAFILTWLYVESERRLQAMRALAATSQAINTTLELDEVLRQLAQHAKELLNVEVATLGLVENGHLIFKEAVGGAAEKIKGLAIEPGQGLVGWVAQHNRPALVPDAQSDPRFLRKVDQQTGFLTRAVACVPITIQGKVIGVIEVINPIGGTFDPETLNLLTSLATLAGTAIVHAQQVAELQAAESRFASLFEDNIDPILITNLDGIITDANRKAVEFFGYSQQELVGLRVTTVHRMGTAFLGSDRFQNLRGGKQLTYQTRITTKSGSEIPVEVHAKVIKRRGQEFIQWIQRDLTEHLELEEMRQDLISMIFHDLRSPLANILSSLDVVQTSLPPEHEVEHSLLSIARRSAVRLSRLVDSLLDLRRLEAGQVVLNKEQTNVNTLVVEAIEQVQSAAEGKGIEVRAEVPPRLPYIDIDADMIRRVIINLLENAIKYTPGAGTITVIAKSDPKEVIVSVRDTGPGIPRSMHTRIFDKFARLQREAAPKGMGLGLAFCKLAVEAHGGRISLESQVGTGSTFTLTLPITS